MKPIVPIYYDYRSQYVYLLTMTCPFEKLEERFDVVFEWRPFELRAEGAELPPRDEALLSLRQIEGVVDFVQAVYQGTGMSKESCYRYYTLTHPMCDRLEEAGGQRQQPARIR